MDKMLVAQGVANKLFASENSIDEALSQASVLLSGLLTARQEMNLSATAGDDIMVKVTAAISALSTARTAMVGAHADLDVLKSQVGIRAKMLATQDKPPQQASQENVTTLRAVAS